MHCRSYPETRMIKEDPYGKTILKKEQDISALDYPKVTATARWSGLATSKLKQHLLIIINLWSYPE